MGCPLVFIGMEFIKIENGERGLSVRDKLNKILEQLVSGEEGVNEIWKSLTQLSKETSKVNETVGTVKELQSSVEARTEKMVGDQIADLVHYVNSMSGGISGLVATVDDEPANYPLDKAVTVLAGGGGTFTHFLQEDGSPINIPSVSAFSVFYKPAGVNWWRYKSVPISAHNISVEQTSGANGASVMSQKAVTEFVNDSVKRLSETATQTTTAISEKVTTLEQELPKVATKAETNAEGIANLVTAVEKLRGVSFTQFDGVVDDSALTSTNELPKNDVVGVYYSTSSKAFVAKDNLGAYHKNWKGSSEYASVRGLYKNGSKLYLFHEGTLVDITSDLYNEINLLEMRIATLDTLAPKTNGITIVQGQVEAGRNPVGTNGTWLRKGANGKFKEVVGVDDGVASVKPAVKGHLYLLDNVYYTFDGSNIEAVGSGVAGATGGSGGGFFNVTTKMPLTNGYYTKETAVRALQFIELTDEQKRGMIIRFETSAGVWSDYEFVGTNVSTFTEPTAWQEYGSKGSIKELRVQVGTKPVEVKKPDASGSLTIAIPEFSADSTITKGSTNPVQGGAVHKALEDIKTNPGYTLRVVEVGDGYQKIQLLDYNDEAISETDPFKSGGGGGTDSAVANRIVLSRITPNLTIKNGDDCTVQYRYDHQNQNGETTGNSAKATVTVTRGSTSYTFSSTIPANSVQSIDVSKYIGVGTNSVRLLIEVGDGEEKQTSRLSWSIQVVQLTLTSSYNIARVVEAGEKVSIPYSVSGSGTKTLRCYVNGIDVEDRTIQTSTANGTLLVITDNFSHGSHSVQLVVELEQLGSSSIMSNSIYFDIPVRNKNITTPLVATRFDYADGRIISAGERPVLVSRQYDSFTLNYAVFDPRVTPTNVTISEDDVVLTSTNVAFVSTEFKGRQNRAGSRLGKILVGDTIYTYKAETAKTDLAVEEPTDGLQLSLSALGKTNYSANRESWDYNDIRSSLSGFMFGEDGWTGTSLKHRGDGRTTVMYKPLEQKLPATNAFAFSIKYKCTEVSDDNAPVVSCLDNGVGFVITPTEVKMTTRGNSTLSMKMSWGQEYEVTIVALPQATSKSSKYETENTEMVHLFINGVMCGCLQRGSSDTIYQQTPKNIEIGSNSASIDVYSIRSYNTFLTDSQVLALYVLGQTKVEDLLREYEDNNVLNSEGEIGVENVPEGLRVMIITGKQQATDVPTVLHAAVVNNKKTKYDVDEILSFVRGGRPEQNFRILGGCISLQGTSSLAYPTKNYRVYSRNAKKVNGQVYVGCDEQGAGGELQSKALFAFRFDFNGAYAGAPVNCMCAKADFAESSSSHNTGLARLVHDTLIKVGDLTPPQKHVDRKKYKYDVRTTVDGEPCLMFYRGSIEDTPVFLGKFNLNNDKSTEAVFGFLKIPGYHDASWVQEKFGGQNPTECWEFLNNDYPMGSFLESDFTARDGDGKLRWLKVFEARFPDDDALNDQYAEGTKRPTHLERLVKWVHSTDTVSQGLSESTIQQRRAKFRNELAEYFDVKYLCDYYVFTDMFACVDQRVKNMMMAFWYSPEAQKMLAYMIFYDNDTILGVRNDGRLRYNWDIDENTIDPELSVGGKTVYAFAGHNSVLWKNLRDMFPEELKQAYIRIRARMTNDDILDMFGKEQSDRFTEAYFNADAIKKYILPKTVGVSVNRDGQTITQRYSYLESMQGNRDSHRRWFVQNRFGLFDAWASTGLYTATDIAWKGNSERGATVRATLARDFYAEFRREGTRMVHKKVLAGEEFTYTYNEVANIGTIFHLLGGAWFRKLDLADWGGFTNLDIPTMPVLEELILGREGKEYGLTELTLGSSADVVSRLPMLKKLSIYGYKNLTNLNLSRCTRLEEVDARGCSKLANIEFASSSTLRKIRLPENYQVLTLIALPYMTEEGIDLANARNLIGLRIEKCANLDGVKYLNKLIALGGNIKYVRVDGINYTGDASILRSLYEKNMGGIDAEGNLVNGKCKLLGNYQLTEYLNDEEFARLKEYFDELNFRQPEYTVIELDTTVADPANMSNLDNKTGYKFGTPYKVSGHLNRILKNRFGCLGKQVEKGTMKVCKLHEENFLKYADNIDPTLATDAVVDGSEGDVFVYEPIYWYKGVNDILGGKKYACFASGEKPSNPTNIKVVQLRNLPRHPNTIIRTNTLDVSSAKVMSYTYTTFELNVDGYKRVRVPTVKQEGGQQYGILYLNEQNEIVGNVVTDVIIDTQYLILTPPQGVTKILFSTNTYMLDDQRGFVVFSNSEKTEDFEPEWVEHKPALVGSVKASVTAHNKLGSVFNPSSPNFVSGRPVSEYPPLLEKRGLIPFDYEERKCISNLAFFLYGTRDIAGVVGGPDGSQSYQLSNNLMRIGLIDTIAGATFTYKPKRGVESSISVGTHTCRILGYDNLFGSVGEFVYGITAETREKHIIGESRTAPYIKNGHYGTYGIYDVVFEKQMDILMAQLGTAGNTRYLTNNTTSYGGWKDSVGFPAVVFGSLQASSKFTFITQILGPTSKGAGYNDAYPTGVRIQYRGNIELVDGVDEYKQLSFSL